MLFVYVVAFFACNPTVTIETCKPEIMISGKPKVRGKLYIDCFTLNCDKTGTIQFEKTGVTSSTEWTPVYDNNVGALHPGGYMNDTYKFRTKLTNSYEPPRTTLVLNSMILQDHGSWRCTATKDGAQYSSERKDIKFFAEPEVLISPTNTPLVTNQIQEYVCEVKGVYPKPTIMWSVNGETLNGTEEYTQYNGLWNVNSTIQLHFDAIGSVILKCVLSTEERPEWTLEATTLTVQEAAELIYPKQKTIKKILANETFTLTCIGSGYLRRVTWHKDGKPLINLDKYTMLDCKSSDQQCTSILLSKKVKEEAGCKDVYDYSGVYTCVVQLEPPYESKVVSLGTTVLVSDIPVLIGFSSNVSETRCTDSRKVECAVCAMHPISDIWLFNDRPITSAGQDQELEIEKTNGDLFHQIGIYKRLVNTSDGYTECIVHKLPAGQFELCVSETIGITVGAAVVLVILIMSGILIVNHSKAKRKVPEVAVVPEYAEISDISNTSSYPIPIGEQRCDEYASGNDDQQYSVCSVDMEYQIYKMKQDAITYKRVDSQGHVTYVTHEELGCQDSIEYIKMDKLSGGTYVNTKTKDTSYNRNLENSSRLTYINKEAIENTKRKQSSHEILVHKPDLHILAVAAALKDKSLTEKHSKD